MTKRSEPGFVCVCAGVVLLWLLAAGAARAQAPDAFDCLLEAHRVSDVASPQSGVLDEVLVERGDLVEEGQLLATLHASVEQATVELASARAELTANEDAARVRANFERNEVARQKELRATDHLAQSALEESETELALAEIRVREIEESRALARLELRRAEAMLEMRRVRSPIPGVVVERLRSAGEYVEEQPLMRIADVSALNVEVVLPAEMLGRVHTGMQARVAIQGFDWPEQTAEVTIVDSVFDGATSTFGVRLLMPNPDRTVPAGLRCSVRFVDDGAVGVIQDTR